MDLRTNGAVVYENMETSLPGVFACGNVVHVHDLVDFVTAESYRAGAAAADYIANGEASGEVVEMKNGDGVTYTVPQKIRTANVEKGAEVFFRVNRICGDSVIKVCEGDRLVARFKRAHMAPGEMEHIMIPKKLLDTVTTGTLTVSIEEAAE